MSLQNPRVYAATIATGASLSAAIDIGGAYLYVSLEIPASGAAAAFPAAGGSPVWIQASSDNVTYRRIYEVYTNSVASAFQIQSSVCNAIVPLNLFNLRYAKIEISGTVTGAGGPVTYKIIAADSL